MIHQSIPQSWSLLDVVVYGNWTLDEHQKVADGQVHHQNVGRSPQRFAVCEHKDDERIAHTSHHRYKTVEGRHHKESARLRWLELQPKGIHLGDVAQVVFVPVVNVAGV